MPLRIKAFAKRMREGDFKAVCLRISTLLVLWNEFHASTELHESVSSFVDGDFEALLDTVAHLERRHVFFGI